MYPELVSYYHGVELTTPYYNKRLAVWNMPISSKKLFNSTELPGGRKEGPVSYTPNTVIYPTYPGFNRLHLRLGHGKMLESLFPRGRLHNRCFNPTLQLCS